MKIFIIPSWYPNRRNAGQGSFIREQAVALRKMGHEVIVLSVQMRRADTLFQKQETYTTETEGVIAHYQEKAFFYPGKLFSINQLLFTESLQKLFAQALALHGRPDVLYAHFSYPAGFAAAQLSMEYQLPLVVEEHFSYYNRKVIPRSLKKILSDTVKRADSFLVVSKGLQAAVERHVPGSSQKSRVISNMIDPCFVYCDKKKHEDFRFFSMGRFIPRKGFLELIEAFAAAHGNNAKVKLYIAGSGPQEPQIQALIRKKNLDKQVFLIGQLTREETLQAYIDCDCFVLASKGETFGLVYREALAVGRPVISTRHQGFFTGDWDESFGYLVDVGDLAQLEWALQKVCEQPDLRGRERSKKCLCTCSAETVMKSIEKILQSASEKGTGK